MQVSWSPIAWCTSAAATAESTPPESAQITRPSPTCARMRLMLSAMKLPAVQSPRQPQTLKRKFSRICLPCGVCTTSGWNWMPMRPRVVRHRRDTASCRSGRATWKPGGSCVMRSPWDIQTGIDGGRPAKSGDSTSPWLTTAWPYSRWSDGDDLAAELVREELHAVADAEHGQAASRRPRSGVVRRVVLVDAGGAAGEDEAARLQLLDLLPGRVVRDELAVDAALAHAAGDEHRELRAEVDDDDRLGLDGDRRRGVGRRLARLLRGRSPGTWKPRRRPSAVTRRELFVSAMAYPVLVSER